MILLTGFNRFGGLEVNSSELIVEAIATRALESGRTDLVSEVLPTEYRRAGDRMRYLIQEYQPKVILALGVATGAPFLRLERVALNLNDAEMPDNAGEVISGQLIEAKGPAAYWSSLPLTAMLEALDGLDVPVVVSNHAAPSSAITSSISHDIKSNSWAFRPGVASSMSPVCPRESPRTPTTVCLSRS